MSRCALYFIPFYSLFQGGSVIRLFHREIECYLVAEGSFANDEGKVIVEQGTHEHILCTLSDGLCIILHSTFEKKKIGARKT